MKNLSEKINILVIQTAFLGDVIMSTPIFKGLKKRFPEANIDALVIPENVNILENNPFINQIISFDKRKLFSKILNFFPLVFRLRKNKYDLAVSIQTSFTSSLIMLFAGAKKRAGNKKMKFLTHKVNIPKYLHRVERIGVLLNAIKKMDMPVETELFLDKNKQEKVENVIISDNKFNIGIAPGSVRETKKWLFENYVELLNIFPDSFTVYLIGAPNEKDYCEKLRLQVKNNIEIINTAGMFKPLESAALIKEMDLLICNDSAPLHMGNAVKTTVFSFFGPTVKTFGCYPYRENDVVFEVDLPCRPCGTHGGNYCPENHFNCMKMIKPKDVLNTIMDYKNKFKK